MQRGTVLEAGGSEASFLLQCYILTKRSFINMSRDFGYYWLRLVIYIVVTICIGTIYLNVGTGYNSILVHSFYNPREIQSFKVSFSFLQIYLLFIYFLIILVLVKKNCLVLVPAMWNDLPLSNVILFNSCNVIFVYIEISSYKIDISRVFFLSG